MRVARLSSLASIGLLLAMAPGCYRPYVSPYGYPSAPVQTLTPGGTYTPTYPNALPPGLPAPIDSYGQPIPTPDGTFSPNGPGSDAPFYNQSNSPPPYSGSEGGVPMYPDTPSGEVQFQGPRKSSPVADESGLESWGSLNPACCTMGTVAKVPVNAAEYLEPVPTHSHEPQPTLAVGTEPVASSRPPFAHDAEGFRWLRGVARLNAFKGTWSIVYSTAGSHSDPYGGRLTLAADPILGQLQPNAVYLISGQLDASRRDVSGKPVYCAHSIKLWQPAPAL